MPAAGVKQYNRQQEQMYTCFWQQEYHYVLRAAVLVDSSCRHAKLASRANMILTHYTRLKVNGSTKIWCSKGAVIAGLGEKRVPMCNL